MPAFCRVKPSQLTRKRLENRTCCCCSKMRVSVLCISRALFLSAFRILPERTVSQTIAELEYEGQSLESKYDSARAPFVVGFLHASMLAGAASRQPTTQCNSACTEVGAQHATMLQRDCAHRYEITTKGLHQHWLALFIVMCHEVWPIHSRLVIQAFQYPTHLNGRERCNTAIGRRLSLSED
jgi:hypothetical protein